MTQDYVFYAIQSSSEICVVTYCYKQRITQRDMCKRLQMVYTYVGFLQYSPDCRVQSRCPVRLPSAVPITEMSSVLFLISSKSLIYT